MDLQNLELEKQERIENLNEILEIYCSNERKSKRILELIVVILAVALYFVLFDLLGGLGGFILTIAIIGVGVLCIENLGLTFKNAPISDGKLAYQACVNMYILVEIKKGTYSPDVANIICVSRGKHLSLYKEFVQLYPELDSRDLEKLAETEVEQKDMF